MKSRLFLFITMLLPATVMVGGQLVFPAIPDSLRAPGERADYLAVHFYDNMDWQDAEMTTPENLMQDWANFLSVLPHCSEAVRDSAITVSINQLPAERIMQYSELADGYLFALDSELCNEATYLKVMAALAAHPGIPADDHAALVARLEYLARCAPATEAVDIEVESLNGDHRFQLHELKGRQSGHILIVFYDPECEDCHELLHRLTTDVEWTSKQASGELTVVKRVIDDEADRLYTILNVPGLYLLDSDFTVLSRNFSF